MRARSIEVAATLLALVEPTAAVAQDAIGELFEIDLPGLQGSDAPDSRIQEPATPELLGVPVRWDGPIDRGSTGGGAGAMWTASIDCDAAGLPGMGQTLRRDLLLRHPASAEAPRAWQRLGAGALALALHAEAAAAFEELVRRFPAEDGRGCTAEERATGSCPLAPEALWDATVLRLALGDRSSAEANAALHQKLYARRRAHETSTLLLAVAEEHAAAGDLRAAARIYDRVARIQSDAMIPALVGRAKALEAVGEHRRALADLAAADAAWATLDAPAASASADAAAEGRFQRAQLLGRAFEELDLPRFVGPSTERAIARWARARLAPWVHSALADLREAEAAFGRAWALRVPRWTIAALARVGQLRRRLHDLLRRVPRPPMEPELSRAYDDLVTDRGDTLADHAADAFRACLALAVATREHGRWSALCATELDSLEPRRALPELRPEVIVHVQDGLVAAPLALRASRAGRPALFGDRCEAASRPWRPTSGGSIPAGHQDLETRLSPGSGDTHPVAKHLKSFAFQPQPRESPAACLRARSRSPRPGRPCRCRGSTRPGAGARPPRSCPPRPRRGPRPDDRCARSCGTNTPVPRKGPMALRTPRRIGQRG